MMGQLIGSIDWDSIDLGSLLHHGVSSKDLMMASLIITDKGRILKNRSGPTSGNIPSFDLVKGAKPDSLKTKLKYRSIYDPSDIQYDPSDIQDDL